MKILILGGYGVFGGRLVQLLADDPGLTLLIAGRSAAAARDFCDRRAAKARLEPLALPRAEIGARLASLAPDLIVDASGPFQDYGAAPYSVLEAAIAAGIDYLDFADGADFVEGFARFDARARAAGIFALSGVSSFPVLTAAVLAEMSRDMTLASVECGIAPSPYAGVGKNVLRAVLGYGGAPVRLIADGVQTTRPGLTGARYETVAPPGHLPLKSTRFSLVDVPDLRLLPGAFPGIRDLWVGAGPRPEALHVLLNALAWLRARRMLPALAPLAPVAHLMLNTLIAGDHRGGMYLTATGQRNGEPARLSWHLLAEGDDGPLIPSMAIALIIRHLRQGLRPDAGARSGIGALTLADYDSAFEGRTIVTGWRDDRSGPLYERILDRAFDRLPDPIRSLHRPGARSVWQGRATVERGRGPVTGLIARLFGFPAAGQDIPVTVTFTTDATGTEIWERRFAGRTMRSVQSEGRGRSARLVTERFGPFRFGLALVVDGDRLRIVPRRWSLLGLPLPKALMPTGDTYETVRDGRFRFHVEIDLPLFGRVVSYDGWLEKTSGSPDIR